MKTLICILVVVFSSANAGFYTTCEIEGLVTTDWLLGYSIREAINDTHRGFIASFTTHNVTGVKVEEPTYLDAVLENGELRLFVTERFNNFEIENQGKGSYVEQISVEISFDCTKDDSDTLTIKVPVIDINNHLPLFNREVYEYRFGMEIPAKFELTELLPISASDVDFTNKKISFSFESDKSEYFTLRSYGQTKYPNYENYYTTIEAKKNISESIREEFTIVATDGREPVSTSTAKLIIVVDTGSTSTPTPSSPVHPPVFSKSVYYADYNEDHEYIMEESISLLFGEPNLILQQSDYAEYFEISYDNTRKEVDVTARKALPDDVLEKNYLIIQIEARNEGLDIPGKTNLVINLPYDPNISTEDKIVMQEVCSFWLVSPLPLIICFSIILVIVIFNIWVVLLYLKRQKLRIDLSNPIKSESKC